MKMSKLSEFFENVRNYYAEQQGADLDMIQVGQKFGNNEVVEEYEEKFKQDANKWAKAAETVDELKGGNGK